MWHGSWYACDVGAHQHQSSGPTMPHHAFPQHNTSVCSTCVQCCYVVQPLTCTTAFVVIAVPSTFVLSISTQLATLPSNSDASLRDSPVRA